MLLLAAGTMGFFASRPMSAQEALILKNVEALASGEDPISTQQCLNPLFFQANSGAASTLHCALKAQISAPRMRVLRRMQGDLHRRMLRIILAPDKLEVCGRNPCRL